MTDPLAQITEDALREADAAGRATHSWLRQRSLQRRYAGEPLSGADERLLAAGFLAGLRGRFALADPECLLAAYAFLLMQQGESATPLAAVLLADAAHWSLATAPQFREGRRAALAMSRALPV